MRTDAALRYRGNKLNWWMISLMIFLHAGAVAALFYFTWSAFALAVFLWWATGSLGIGMGYHRLLTHRGFKTPKWVEYSMAFLGTLALEGGPIPWVATHRIHHMHTDQDGDPHSPSHGFWWSHLGWILNGTAPYTILPEELDRVKDLTADPVHRWLTKWHIALQVVFAAMLFAIGGLPFVLWGIFFRVIFALHATLFVNSASHVWGSRRFETKDTSRNLWWVALISHGEGWHNNHHAHPSAARHGLAWYEIDVNWYGIWTLKQLGLITDLRLTKLPKQQRKLKLQPANAGDSIKPGA